MKFAYADPPYLGCCGLYDHHHEDPYGCWDDPATHQTLIDTLVGEFPDGWALSCSTPSLRTILPMCPPDVRVAAWVKPFCAFKRGVRPCYAWEPIIFRGGRNPGFGHPHAPPEKGGKQNTPKDYIAESITLRKGLTGVKPDRVNDWILDLLNFKDAVDLKSQYGDELVDLFPGMGGMSRSVSARTMLV